MKKEAADSLVKDKLKKSTTLAIVIFAMVFLLYNSILQQFLGKEISYMGDLVGRVFSILMIYVGGNKVKDTVQNIGKKK